MPGEAAVAGWKYMLGKPADGHTALISSPTPIIALARQGNPSISPRDVKIVCFISAFNVVLFTRPGRPWSTWPGLVSYAKAHPGKLSYGSTYSEMSGAALSFKGAGIDVKLNPYSSTSNAVTDLLGGQIDIAAATPSTIAPMVPDQVVAILNSTKMPLHKDVADRLGGPLHAVELGYHAINYPRWIGVHPDTPDSIVAEMSDKIGEMLQQDSFIKIMRKMGEDIIFVPHAEAQAQYEEIVSGISLAVDAIDA
jgi:tripartite-type tricarboxylate transporter receptor subunit TctC